MKRIKQISVDIAVDDTVNGDKLADEIAYILMKTYAVMGTSFVEDLTELYGKVYPNLIYEKTK